VNCAALAAQALIVDKCLGQIACSLTPAPWPSATPAGSCYAHELLIQHACTPNSALVQQHAGSTRADVVALLCSSQAVPAGTIRAEKKVRVAINGALQQALWRAAALALDHQPSSSSSSSSRGRACSWLHALAVRPLASLLQRAMLLQSLVVVGDTVPV
jgi:hypothetical protein